jgi:TetR/AcrR family transcriptional regulator, transcriptional repressor of bet genes
MIMPKQVDHLERRQAIAEAAVASIAAHGLDGAKLTRIAKAAGVTTGAVTHYFEDKDEVLLAALDELCRRLMQKLGERDTRPVTDQLADALPLDRQSLDEWRVWIAFWGRAAFVPALARVHRAYYQAIQAELAKVLRGSPDPDLDAATIIAAIDGIGTRACLEPELWPAERQRATLARMLAPIFNEGNDHASTAAPVA